jgi:hypothetical protein
MPLEAGSKAGPYEIVALSAAGGMDDVGQGGGFLIPCLPSRRARRR